AGTPAVSRVVVVGGGLAGLTAALDLVDRGQDVTLLEARPRLGGLTASFARGGLTVDTGQHVFLRCCTAYLGLLDRLGVAHLTTMQDRLDVPVWVDGTRKSLRRNGFRPPLHLAAGLLSYLGLVRAARAVPAALGLQRLDVGSPAVDAQTFGGWLAEHGQDRAAVDALWGLLTVATLNCDPDEASLALAAKVVQTGLFETAGGADIGVPDVPLGRLHGDAFAAALAGADVKVNAKVTAIACADGSSRGRSPAGFDVSVGAEVLHADAVVVAVPPAVAAGLLPGQAAVNVADLGSSPIVNVHVHYDRPVLDVPFLATVGSPLQWVFDRTAASGATTGQYVAVSLSAADLWLPQKAADILSTLLPELVRVLPAARHAEVVDAFVTREPHATFRQVAGSAASRPSSATAVHGLALAGAWTDTGWPATMEGAVRSGHTAASVVTAASVPELAVAS
ncbi:MAG: hydroxysqualene dehydroxylase HpnE, partial [Mycobacteriales bacterium]